MTGRIFCAAALAAAALSWAAPAAAQLDRTTQQINIEPRLLEVHRSTRFMLGVDIGISRTEAETAHFFPPANVAGTNNGPTVSFYGEYHRAFHHDPVNRLTFWGRAGASITAGDMEVVTAPNFGNEMLRSTVGPVIITGYLGASIQVHRAPGRPYDFCVMVVGGPAFANIEDDFAGQLSDRMKAGWMIKTGIEVLIPNTDWTVAGYYRHVDLGETKLPIGPGVGVDHKIDRFSIALGYRFYPGAR